ATPRASGSAGSRARTPGNTTAEDDKSITVTLTKVEFADDTTDTVALGATTTAKGNVIDDDWRIAALTSVPANATVAEAGSNVIDFQIKLVDSGGNAVNAPPNHKITIDYEVDDGTPAGLNSAVNGTNYTITDPAGKASGTLTFAPGTGVVHVKVQSRNDGVYGLDKQFTIS